MSEFLHLRWLFKNYTAVLIIYVLAVIGVSTQSLLLDEVSFVPGGAIYPQYNNYLIFKQSFYHLIHDQDLYTSYPDEQGDLFKYSPSFALLFGSLAVLPDSVGLVAWNLLNAFCLFLAFRAMPECTVKAKVLMLLYVLVELVTSIQNSQSNALMAGMIILAFAMLERGRYFTAALLITGTVYIKIFGLFAFALFLFYPNKLKFIASSVICVLVLAGLPLLAVSWDQLQFLYTSWLDLLVNDHSVSYGISVMGWLTTWFNINANKNIVVLIGLVLLGLPFLRWKKFGDFQFRVSTLALILIWIVIFNHKAESPTYIIAVAGVAVWYFTDQRTTMNFFLVAMCLVFTALSPTDIFPASIQDSIFDPYVVKVVPCILIFIKILFETLVDRKPIAPQLS